MVEHSATSDVILVEELKDEKGERLNGNRGMILSSNANEDDYDYDSGIAIRKRIEGTRHASSPPQN